MIKLSVQIFIYKVRNLMDSNFVAGLVREKIILIFSQNVTDIQSTVWGQEIVVHHFTDFSQRWKLSNTRNLWVKVYTQFPKNLLVFSRLFLCVFFYMRV